MKPLIREINEEYFEVIGHYDNPILCAKLTVIADMFAIEHKNGYAKFRIEDEDKLSFIDKKLEFTLDDAITVYINGTETGYIEGSEPWSYSIGRYASALPNMSISDGKVLCNGKQLYLNGVAVNSTDYPVGGAYYLTSSLTTLTGTTWLINNVPSLPSGYGIFNNIDFTSNNRQFNRIYIGYIPELDSEAGALSYISNMSSDALAYYDNSWYEGEEYRTITITGGTDTTNATLIAWLEANAVQQTAPAGDNKISIGASAIANAFVGSSDVTAMYLGSTQIYGTSSTPSSSYTVTITLQNGLSPYGGENIYIYDDIARTHQIATSSNYNDALTVQTSTGIIVVACVSGGSTALSSNGSITTTGGVTETSHSNADFVANFSVTGDGTIVIDKIDWDF